MVSVVVALVLVAALVGAGLAVALRDRAETADADPNAVLERARSFVRDQETVRFDLRQSITYDGLEESFSVTESGTYEEEIPDRSRLRTDGEVAFEEIRIGSTFYTRSAPLGTSIADLEWNVNDDQFLVARQPGFDEILDPVRNPEVLEVDGSRVTLGLDADPEQFFFEWVGSSDALMTRRLEVVVAADGEVESVEAVGRGTDLRYGYEALDIEWGGAVDVGEPGPDEIDETPLVADEVIGAFEDATILTPGSIPEGWELLGATVLEAEDTVEKCRQGYIGYSEVASGDQLRFFSLPVTCEAERAPGARDIEIGGGTGWIGTVDGESAAELIIGDTRFQARTNLDEDQLLQVLERIVAFDPANPPPADLRLRETS